jgi:ribosome-binding protein aMBF1 (putative translation factor)
MRPKAYEARVKVFFAWSGPTSEQLAEFMREWIPSVIQAVKPFMSTQDIRKGQRWANEIGARLADADFAVLCLTPTNLNSRWIHYEAGAVSRIEGCRVSALLLDVPVTQIEFPLQQFQHTRLTKRDLWQFVRDLNERCKTPLDDARLRKAFERNYPDVEAEIERLKATLAQEQGGHAAPARSTEAILSDLLTVQQGMEEKLTSLRAEVRRSEAPGRAESPISIRRVRPPSTTLVRENIAGRRLGEVLRHYRHARGLSQEMLASKARVDRVHVFQIEFGRRLPTIPVLCRLARALQISPAALLSGLQQQLSLDTANTAPRLKARASKGQLN